MNSRRSGERKRSFIDLDGERVGEALDAQRDRLAALRERARVGGGERGREALAQPFAGGVQREHARGVEADVDLAGVEEQRLRRRPAA